MIVYVCTGFFIKVPDILARLWGNLNFLDRLLKNIPMPNFMKILLMGAELFHADRQKDRHDTASSRISQSFESAHEMLERMSISEKSLMWYPQLQT
jgi:hypothetical protein